MKQAASIGIIGGADGPTAVFVAGNPVWTIVIGVVVVAAIAGIVLALTKK